MNLESPVLFSSARNLLELSFEYSFVEIGPHAALEIPLSQIWSARGVQRKKWLYQPVMLRGKDSVETLLRTLGNLWQQGFNVDFDQINQTCMAKNTAVVITSLPSYVWTHNELLWTESRTTIETRNRQHARDELLGARVPCANVLSQTWRNLLRLDDVPWLRDHTINGECVFSVRSYVTLVLRAMRQLLSCQSEDNHDLTSYEIHNKKFSEGLHLT